MLVHSELHINNITNMNENSFPFRWVQKGEKAWREVVPSQLASLWQQECFNSQNTKVFTSSLIPGIDFEMVCQLFWNRSGHVNCLSPHLPYYTVCILGVILLNVSIFKKAAALNCSLDNLRLCAWFCCWQRRVCRDVRRNEEWAIVGLLLPTFLCWLHVGLAGM